MKSVQGDPNTVGIDSFGLHSSFLADFPQQHSTSTFLGVLSKELNRRCQYRERYHLLFQADSPRTSQ